MVSTALLPQQMKPEPAMSRVVAKMLHIEPHARVDPSSMDLERHSAPALVDPMFPAMGKSLERREGGSHRLMPCGLSDGAPEKLDSLAMVASDAKPDADDDASYVVQSPPKKWRVFFSIKTKTLHHIYVIFLLLKWRSRLWLMATWEASTLIAETQPGALAPFKGRGAKMHIAAAYTVKEALRDGSRIMPPDGCINKAMATRPAELDMDAFMPGVSTAAKSTEAIRPRIEMIAMPFSTDGMPQAFFRGASEAELMTPLPTASLCLVLVPWTPWMQCRMLN